jgi:hypothetical protein
MSIKVVNMIPKSLSGETSQDSEPNLAVNPNNPLQMAATAFTPNPSGGTLAPIYVSSDGGSTWALNAIVPGATSDFPTSDITTKFGGTSNILYGGILRADNTDLNILRTSNFLSSTAMTVLVDRSSEDQPWVEAATVPAVLVTLDTTNSGWRTSWDLIVVGNFLGNGRQQILLYDRTAGQADVVGFDATGTTDLDTTNSGWRTSWDLIVVGNFVGNGRDQVLLYDRTAGQADVVGFDNTGKTNLDTTNSGWRTSWDLIVVGNFVGNGRDQVLLYDRTAGQADVVGFDATGKTNLDNTNSGWRTTWDQIVVGEFLGNGLEQVLLYDRTAGQADVVGFDNTGKTNLDFTNSGWRTTWDQIAVGAFVGNGRDQVLLYDHAAGQADIVGFENTGESNLDTTNSGWRTTWNPIVAGTFLGNNLQQVLLYDRAAGQSDVVGFDSTGGFNLDTTNSGWRTTWDLIVVGDFLGGSLQQVLLYDRTAGQADVVAFTGTGNPDRVYIGNNDFNSSPNTATIDQSLNAASAGPPAGFGPITLENTSPAGGQDAPSIRQTIHSSGMIYVAYMSWTGDTSRNVVVRRDNNWGQSGKPYTWLGTGGNGVKVVTGVTIPFENSPFLGQERIGSHLSIAVDPNSNNVVYLAWADFPNGVAPYTIHLRQSTDAGVTWSSDLRAIANGINPAIAVNSQSHVGFLYQTLTNGDTWETHIEISQNEFATAPTPNVLASVPSNTPAHTFLPYLGDYIYLTSVGTVFYGVFSANNTPDLANFPNGVTYQRNADFTTKILLDVDNKTPVAVSIDPFFFSVTESVFPIFPISPILPVFPLPVQPVAPVQPITPIFPVKPIAPIHPITPVAPIKPVAPITPIKPVHPITPVLPIHPISPQTRAKPATSAKPKKPKK